MGVAVGQVVGCSVGAVVGLVGFYTGTKQGFYDLSKMGGAVVGCCCAVFNSLADGVLHGELLRRYKLCESNMNVYGRNL